nr:MAG TPA: hypothetical protein [Caudoviricetes sp.]
MKKSFSEALFNVLITRMLHSFTLLSLPFFMLMRGE